GRTKINITEDGILIQMNIILRYGNSITNTVQKIQEKLKKELDYITGINVIKINILVEDLIMENNKV
ncbi:MAG: Asp23/Gls24 family envelope stress response protein, partial [Candidatus Caldatribacteriota bacterium]